jgi:hypothetical protein
MQLIDNTHANTQRTTELDRSSRRNDPAADNSLLYDAYLVSEHPEIKAAFEVIWPDYSSGLTKLKRERDALLNFLCNMAMSFALDRSVALPMSKSAFEAASRCQELFLKYRRTRRLRDYLLEHGWVEIAQNFRSDRGGDEGKVTRYRPTARLTEFLCEICEDDIEPDLEEVETVVLRKTIRSKDRRHKKSVPVEYLDHRLRPSVRRFVVETRSQLALYNRLLFDGKVEYISEETVKQAGYENMHQFVVLHGLKNAPIPTVVNTEEESEGRGRKPLLGTNNANTRIRSYLRRIFTAGDKRFRSGGRLHCHGVGGPGHQTLSQDERRTITIDGVPTVELDYSCLHPRMLYALEGKQYDGDAYTAVFEDKSARALLKTLVNAALCASPKQNPVIAVGQEVGRIRRRVQKKAQEGRGSKPKDKHLELLRAHSRYGKRMREFLETFKEVHQPIAKYIGTGVGPRLQRLDSDIIMDVVMHFTEQGIICLPVHDSVIIAAQHEDELLEAMQEAYKRNMSGFECPVDRK